MFGLAIAAFLAIGYWRYRVNKILGHWTPERSAMYRAAMRYERNPAKLMEMAQHFQEEGFPDKAFPLRTRAALVNMPADRRMQIVGHPRGYGAGRMHGELGSSWALFGTRETVSHRSKQLTRGTHATFSADELMRRALSSGKPDVIQRVAVGLEKTGRGACADLLKSYARGLDAAGEVEDSSQAQFGYGNVLGAGAQFGYGNVLGAGAQFGIGTIIPSQYIPPLPPPAPPQPPQDPNADPNADGSANQ
jgi:hypothetical protein